ncbi:MAG TPA: amidohydrolase family protein [Burkholderiales bacterium]|nr:amidohydrolase family protein [Burkholderiales bacterium]
MPEQPAAGAPSCAPPDFKPRRPRFAFPANACDCHAHVLGPAARYPYSSARVYTPADCVLRDYRHMLDTLGVERAVLVQPSAYGTDNAAMLDAIRSDPKRLRGVAVVHEAISDHELKRLDEAGVRGVRVNIVDVKERKPGTLPIAELTRLARRIQPLGWHMEFLMHVDEFPDMDRTFADFPVEIVLGHLGYMRTDKGIDAPGFQALLRSVKAGKCWVKLTGPMRISTAAPPYPDVVPYAHALTQANPERIVWGTDWPHVIIKGAMPNDGDLADLVPEWIPDAALREQILVKNPTRLYRFP